MRRTLDCLRSCRLSHGSRAPERRVLTSTKTSVCAVVDDEVELTEARPVVAGEHLEAEAVEVLGGELLAASSRCLPDVGHGSPRYVGSQKRIYTRLLQISARNVQQSHNASCWYAIDWNDIRCSGETPSLEIAARCSGVE